MFKHSAMTLVLCCCVFPVRLHAQAAPKADFGRDVQPIFKTYCVGCHGPTQQMNGFRLDRRRDAMRGGTIAVIGPGNSAGSRLYQRLIGREYGLRMPPTGPLPQEKIDIIKAWIDEGAPWPDALSGETPPPPPDPGATALMTDLRRGDSAAFEKQLSQDPKAATRKGPDGSTPLMYAALYGNTDSMKRLLAAGADPNARNAAGATALMWAAYDLDKARLLVDHGADVNAHSDGGRTPLMIAATRHGSTPVLQLLLDHGANPSAQAPGLHGMMTPLAEAAYASDVDAMRTLIAHGADVNGAGANTLSFAILGDCMPCFNLVIGLTDKANVTMASFFDEPPLGDALFVKTLLDRGGDPKAADPDGDTLLTLTSASDAAPADLVRMLLDRGIDVNAASKQGDTALALAMRHGHTPVVDLLTKAGARTTDPAADEPPEIKAMPAHSAREAVERSLALLQQTNATFMKKSGCVSCHNNTMTFSTIAVARENGIPVDEQSARQQVQAVGTYVDGWRDRALLGVGIPGDADTIGAILFGLADAKYPATPATDAMALFLKHHQSPDGRWYATAHRPPLESSAIQTTAAAMRSLQAYAPQSQRAEYDRAVQHAAEWLAQAKPRTTQDRAYRLLGLAWTGADRMAIKQDGAALLAEQRPDGGWAQLPTLASDAFATGQVLVALAQSGALDVTDAAYRRGTQYLMSTQLADGSWYVKRRALPIQPYFESGFPHGRDQFISAAATNWATTALALEAGSSGPVTARLARPQ
ncbi:MAG TPA: ankyrin repeat domain-containing protein [Terriglobia bacterium]|nr:ankyrin repeat domain-containing protein [Terriglobia bacterium]